VRSRNNNSYNNWKRRQRLDLRKERRREEAKVAKEKARRNEEIY
jgi:hypothetical protein